MFGLIKTKNVWNFAAFGKHPVAGDYLSLGGVTPLLKGFSAWMESGYSLVEPHLKNQGALTWMFWAKGPNGKMICGILKNSTDKHGRPYPLMIAGEGRLPDVGREWDLIPFACEKTWMMQSAIGDRAPDGIKDFKRGLSKIKGPGHDPERWRLKRETVRQLAIPLERPGSASDYMNKMNNVDGLSRKDSFSLWIDVGRPDQVMVPASKFLSLMRHRTQREPGTVFIGGYEGNKRLVFLKRSLARDDFRDLWLTGAP